jgi:thymidylate synthase
MRSNDLIWGLCYDLFFLTALQELMAAELGTALGTYTHMASSMHAYERHWDMLRRIAETPPAQCDPMKPLSRLDQMGVFLDMEAALRQGRAGTAPKLDHFWVQLLEPLRELSERRHSSGDQSHLAEEVA